MSRRNLLAMLVILIFIAAAAGSYFFMRNFSQAEKQVPLSPVQSPLMQAGDITVLRIYQPRGGRLEMIEKKIPKRISSTAIAEAVIEEFFRQPLAEGVSGIPLNVKLLGLYKDEAQMLYIDLSDEVRRNFQGDALSEYLLLSGIYKSLVSNVQDFQDVKMLVEGRELETLGGHFYLKYPLKDMLTTELRGDTRI
ncbi:MAG: GerMN domain-containing protein [Nitrospirota bacterium]|nr:GerMN domain-containing protein [Nitrospirota bacterium]